MLIKSKNNFEKCFVCLCAYIIFIYIKNRINLQKSSEIKFNYLVKLVIQVIIYHNICGLVLINFVSV